MLGHIWAITRKDLKLLLKQPGEWLLLFLTPFLFIAIMGQIFGGEGPPRTVVFLVDEDDSRLSRQIVRALEESEGLELQRLASREDADVRVGRGDRMAAIVIPEGFEEAYRADSGAEIEVVLDPARDELGSIVVGLTQQAIVPWIIEGEVSRSIDEQIADFFASEGLHLPEDASISQADIEKMFKAMILGVVSTQVREAMDDPLVKVELVSAGGEEVSPRVRLLDAMVPGYTAMYGFFIVLTIATTMLAERQGGTFRRLLSAPVSRPAILLGKLLPYYLVIILQILVLLVVSHVVFGTSLGDSPAALAIMTLTAGLSAVALGIFIATVIKTEGQASGTAALLILVMAAVSGAMYPLIRVPGLMYVTPHYWIIQGFLDLIARGGNVASILPEAGALLAFSVLFFGLAVWRFRFD